MAKGSGSTRDSRNNSYQMTSADADSLRYERGMSLGLFSVDYYNESTMQRFNIMRYDDVMSEIVNDFEVGEMDKTLRLGTDLSSVRYKSSKLGESGYPEFDVWREFYVEDGKKTVEHSRMVLPERMQKNRVSKRINGVLMEQYKKMGIDQIKLRANSTIGGYAWANYGFNAQNRREAYESISHRKYNDPLVIKATKIIDDYYTTHQPNAPFPMKLLSSMEGGKKLLLGGHWEGVLNMKDKNQVRMYEQYVLR